MTSGAGGFDRVRPRTPVAPGRPPVRSDGQPDAEGRRALFSTGPEQPARGTVTVDCSRCGTATVLSATQAARLVVPSVHLPVLRREHPSWLRCPACRRRSWVRLTVRLS